jgi:hypothetical protein
MRNKLKTAILLAALLLSSAAQSVKAQEAPSRPPQLRTDGKAVSYAFVSPNVREGLTLEEATRLLGSREESRLVGAARSLACRLRLADGAEHSMILRLTTDGQTVEYAASRLGALERQKAVLFFRRQKSGAARMYVLYVRTNDLARISRTLDADGIQYRTLVPRRHHRAVVYVVDLKGDLRQEQLALAARHLFARLLIFNGTGQFLGDDNSRDQARQLFLQIIRSYESTHSLRKHYCGKLPPVEAQADVSSGIK